MRQRARKGEGERLREDILDAAEALLIERGHPDAVSIRAIADRVGVSPPAIYLHFADKVELFFECCGRRFGELGEIMARAAAAAGPTAMDHLDAVGRAYMKFGLERAEQYQVLMLGPTPESIEVEDLEEMPGPQSLIMVSATVAEGVASGELRNDLDPMATAVSLWAACHGTVLVLLSKRRAVSIPLPAEDVVVEHTIQIIRRGLLA